MAPKSRRPMGAEEPKMQPMRLRSEPGGGVIRRGGNVEVHPGLAAQAAASGGTMSWTCPRCQQPVFFGEARPKGEKGGASEPLIPGERRGW